MKIDIKLINILMTGVTCFCIAPHSAVAAEQSSVIKKWGPHADFELRKGNMRGLFEGDFFIPLGQDETHLLFMDIRGKRDDQQTKEGNIGLGYRKIIESPITPSEKWILGGYAFFDARKTQHNNKFYQTTIGSEILSENYDFRFNLYLPQNTEKEISGTASVTAQANASHQLRLVGTDNLRERALPGFDAEAGIKLPAFKNIIDDMHLYGGGYYFNADGYDKVTGPRARLELRWNDIKFLGKGSRFTLGAEAQFDHVRGDQEIITARLRIPLDTIFGRNKHKQPRPQLSTIQQRMTETIVRDVDIVAGKQSAPTIINEPVKVTINGRTSDNVYVFNANDDVPTGVTNAGAGAIIVLDGSAGTINDGATSIVPLDNQIITGGGLTVTGSNSGFTATIGTRPTVKTTHGSVPVFDLTDKNNITLTNLDITDGTYGIYAHNAAGNQNNYNTLSDLTISNTSSTGMYLYYTDYGTYSNISITGAGANAMYLYGSDHGSFSDLTLTNSTSYGIDNSAAVNSFSNVTIQTAGAHGFHLKGGSNTLNNITINDAHLDGLLLDGASGANITNLTVSNSGTDAVHFITNSSSNTLTTATITTTAGQKGIYLESGNNSNAISNITVSNGSYGVWIDGNANTVTNLSSDNASANSVIINGSGNTFDHITVTNNQNYGISIGGSSANLSNFSVTTSSGTAIDLSADTSNGANVSNGTLSGGNFGLFAQNDTNSTFSDIAISTPGAGNYAVLTFGSAGLTTNNISITSSDYGFALFNTGITAGTGNTSASAISGDCLDGGGNTGSIQVNAGTCP